MRGLPMAIELGALSDFRAYGDTTHHAHMVTLCEVSYEFSRIERFERSVSTVEH